MTPEEYVKLSDDYQEITSICDGLNHELVSALLKKKYIKAQMTGYKLQKQLEQGKQFGFKYYGNTIIIENIIGAVTPFTKENTNLNINAAERFIVKIKVEYTDTNGNKQYRNIPVNGIYEYVDPASINPNEYQF